MPILPPSILKQWCLVVGRGGTQGARRVCPRTMHVPPSCGALAAKRRLWTLFPRKRTRPTHTRATTTSCNYCHGLPWRGQAVALAQTHHGDVHPSTSPPMFWSTYAPQLPLPDPGLRGPTTYEPGFSLTPASVEPLFCPWGWPRGVSKAPSQPATAARCMFHPAVFRSLSSRTFFPIEGFRGQATEGTPKSP